MRLLRSLRDGTVFDRPLATVERYVEGGVRLSLALWRPNHQESIIEAGRKVRVEVPVASVVRFRLNGERAGELATREAIPGLHVADLPTEDLLPNSTVTFALRRKTSRRAGGRWHAMRVLAEGERSTR